MSVKTRALVLSFLRVLSAAALAAYLELGKAPLELGLEDFKALGNAAIAAVLLTAFNYVRSGETRFGLNASEVGMGGDDVRGG